MNLKKNTTDDTLSHNWRLQLDFSRNENTDDKWAPHLYGEPQNFDLEQRRQITFFSSDGAAIISNLRYKHLLQFIVLLGFSNKSNQSVEKRDMWELDFLTSQRNRPTI